MGPGPLGFVYFVGVKLAGYTVAASLLKKVYGSGIPGLLNVAVTGTVIGLGAGLAYGGLWILAISKSQPPNSNLPEFLYFAGLFPVRIAECLFLIYLYFDRRFIVKPKGLKAAIGGTSCRTVGMLSVSSRRLWERVAFGCAESLARSD